MVGPLRGMASHRARRSGLDHMIPSFRSCLKRVVDLFFAVYKLYPVEIFGNRLIHRSLFVVTDLAKQWVALGHA
jgi:hypothetical protein